MKGEKIKVKYKETKKITKKVIEEILDVKEKSYLTAETLLERAKEKDNPLNKFFEWNDTSAGVYWRLQQARQLINEVKIYVEDKELYAFENIKIEQFSSDSSIKKEKRIYEGIIEIYNDKEKRLQLINRALKEVKYWRARHSELIELKFIFNSIDNEDKKWQKK